MIRAAIWVSVLLTLSYAVLFLFRGRLPAMGLMLGMCAVFSACGVVYARTGNTTLASLPGLLLYTLAIPFSVHNQGVEAYFWPFVIPPVAFFFLGCRVGALLCVLALGSLAVSLFGFPPADLRPIYRLDIMVAFSTVAVLAFFAERINAANEAKLARLASRDNLTGCWNRTKLQETLKVESARALRYRLPVSIILIDVDHFKNVNDRHGHATGDRVLKAVTLLVSDSLREVDYLFRWGGEEFLVLAYHADEAGATALANRLRHVVQAHDFPEVGALTISLGVTQLLMEEIEDLAGGGEQGEAAQARVVARADGALYRAKGAGRNRVVAVGPGA